LGGTQEIFIAASEDLLGGTGKAEDAKSAGRRNYPEAVPNAKSRKRENKKNWVSVQKANEQNLCADR
jgi:hypothetical protein